MDEDVQNLLDKLNEATVAVTELRGMKISLPQYFAINTALTLLANEVDNSVETITVSVE